MCQLQRRRSQVTAQGATPTGPPAGPRPRSSCAGRPRWVWMVPSGRTYSACPRRGLGSQGMACGRFNRSLCDHPEGSPPPQTPAQRGALASESGAPLSADDSLNSCVLSYCVKASDDATQRREGNNPESSRGREKLFLRPGTCLSGSPLTPEPRAPLGSPSAPSPGGKSSAGRGTGSVSTARASGIRKPSSGRSLVGRQRLGGQGEACPSAAPWHRQDLGGGRL